MRSPAGWLVLIFWLFCSCAPAPSPSPASPTAADFSSRPPVDPAAAATGAATTLPAADKSAPEPQPPAPPPSLAPVEVPLHVLARSDKPRRLDDELALDLDQRYALHHRFDNGIVAREGFGMWLSLVTPAGARRDLGRGLQPDDTGSISTAWALAGRWPRDLHVAWEVSRGRPYAYVGAVYRWQGGRWREVKRSEHQWHYRRLCRWTGDRILGHAVYERFSPLTPPKVAPPSGSQRQVELVSGKPSQNTPEPRKGFSVTDLDCLPSGEVVVLGRQGETLVWRGGGGPEALALPSSTPAQLEVGKVFAIASDATFVTGSDGAPYLAKLEPQGWSQIKIPAAGHAMSVATGADGSLWVTIAADDKKRRVLRRDPEGQWGQLVLPAADLIPVSVHSIDGELWIWALRKLDGGFGVTVLTTKVVAKPWKL